MNALEKARARREKSANALYHKLHTLNFNLLFGDAAQRAAARSLMKIIGRAQYELETCGDESDISFAAAVLELAEVLQEAVGLKQRRVK